MLTIFHPDILPSVLEFPGGLLPARNGETGELLLILKVQKEYILAAQLRGGFRFYLAPLPSTSGLTVALATAFFDDSDEPLVVRTPLFDDPLGVDLLELLGYAKAEFYFFDEHGREWMSQRGVLRDNGSLITTSEDFSLLPYHPQTVNSIYESLETWFGHRSAADDAKAIDVIFEEELSPSDIVIFDARTDQHDYHGSRGFSHLTLERKNPGYLQERDIAAGLKRAFHGEQIAVNPMRRDNGKEFVDILAFTQTHLLLIQAKDSPNTEASLSRTMDRKRHTSHSQIKKAVKQAKGAFAYAQGRPNLELTIDGVDFNVQACGKTIINLVVVQEMFTDEGDSFVVCYREMERSGDVFVMLDYAAFNAFCHEFSNDQELLYRFAEYSAAVLAGDKWIDPRSYVLQFIQNRLGGLERPPL